MKVCEVRGNSDALTSTDLCLLVILTSDTFSDGKLILLLSIIDLIYSVTKVLNL